MDAMTEMFYDESSDCLRDMRKSLLQMTPDHRYGQETIQEIFRGVHTLKADTAMMLYEEMEALSAALESLLYCFRGEGKTVDDTARFAYLINEYLDFFEDETDKLTQGRTPDGSAQELLREITEYTKEMTAQMKGEEREQYQESLSKPKRQIFYIAGAVTEPEETEKQEKASKKRYMISDDARERICRAARELARVVSHVECSVLEDGGYRTAEKYMQKLHGVLESLEAVRGELVDTDFEPVARKMEIVVDEMSADLGKPVKLLVKGEHTLVDGERREKISAALLHVIRNAVDHGIEDEETRERAGKSPMGLVKLHFYMEDGRLKITVKDDGAGVDTEKVLKKAEEKHLLTKLPEEYTENEVYDLLLLNGVTTTEQPNEYSGRGVGMDVICHNVQELGGELKISSKLGLGTKITMKF